MADSDKTVAGKRASQPEASDPAPASPQSPRYTAGPEIARGGMGRVIEATDALLGRTVAVKQVLSRDPELLQRFARETRITARLEHPSIVPVYDAGTTADGSPYYVMRKVSGRPLEQLVVDATTLAQRLALVPHVLAAAQAVAHAHERGVVHRDLKPSNILVGAHGETVVIDWGLAKVIDDPDDPDPGSSITGGSGSPLAGAGDSLATRIGVVFGTPGFMPPEQLTGDPVDERGDVYALGATLYHLLSQHAPHEASSGTEMMGQAMLGPPKPLDALVPGVPPELSTIVDKALARDPRQRYPHAGAFADELSRFLTGQLVASHRYSRRERLRRFVAKHRISLAVAGLAIVGLAAFGAIAIARVLEERDRADASARLATKRQHDAEAASDRESERSDQLVLLQARTLVDSNPTAAVATLKQLRAPPERWDRLWRNARGIAAGARSNGVARSMQGPELPAVIRLSPDDGQRVVLLDLTHLLWSCDVAAGTACIVTQIDGYVDQLEFLDATRVLGWGGRSSAPEAFVYDVATGKQLARIPLPATPRSLVVTTRGVVWADTSHHLWRIGLSDLRVERLPSEPIQELWASHQRDRVLVQLATSLGTLDLETFTVRELVKAVASDLTWSADDTHVALVTETAYGHVELATRDVRWYAANGRPLFAGITREHLVTVGSDATLRIAYKDTLELRHPDAIELRTKLSLTRGGRLVVVSGRHLVIVEGNAVTLLNTPLEEIHRLAAHPNSRYIVAAGRGRLFVWDLDSIWPTPVARVHANNYVLGDRASAVFASTDGVWHWLDLATGAARTLDDALSPFVIPSVTWDPALVIGVDMTNDHAFAIHRDGRVELITTDAKLVQYQDDGVFLVVHDDGTLDAVDLAKHAVTPLRTTPGNVVSIAWSSGAIALQYDDGSVWRRERSGRETTHTFATGARSNVALFIDSAGSIIVPNEDRLMSWRVDDTLVELAKLPDAIEGLNASANLFIVTTRDRSSWVLDSAGVLAGRIPAGVADMRPSVQTSLAVFSGAAHSLRMADLLANERWSVYPANSRLPVRHPQISADGEIVAGIAEGNLVFWPTRLPTTAAATAAWLDELTNATTDTSDTALAWPTPPR